MGPSLAIKVSRTTLSHGKKQHKKYKTFQPTSTISSRSLNLITPLHRQETDISNPFPFHFKHHINHSELKDNEKKSFHVHQKKIKEKFPLCAKIT
jgi:hypothetical protein